MPGETFRRIALIGFGEAGGILGCDFAKLGVSVSIWDILLRSKKARPAMLARAHDSGVRVTESLRECLRDAELVISAVTASSAGKVAREAAPLLRSGQLYLDINSVSPETKRAEARRVEKGKGDFVEAAVMEAFPPRRLEVPMLLGGKRAAEAAERFRAMGMNATAVSDQIGVASAVKMCRSVFIKGLEALAVEGLFAARRYGAEEAVLASLDLTYPSMGWKTHLPDYLISRVAEHGVRRAAEMREASLALADVGIDPLLSERTAKRQDWLAREMAARGVRYSKNQAFSWRTLADTVHATTKSRTPRARKRKSR